MSGPQRTGVTHPSDGAEPKVWIGVWIGIEKVDDGELWGAHQTLKARLLDFVRRRVSEQKQRRGALPELLEQLRGSRWYY